MTLSNVIIDDNFLSQSKQDELLHLFISSGIFNWHLNLKTNDYINKDRDTFQFTHSFFMNGESQSEYYNLVMGVFNDFLNKHNLKCTKIIRAKANLSIKNNKVEHLEPHIDTNIPHKVFLYYINDSDGPTIFYSDKVDELKPIRAENDLIKNKEVNPLKGRAINFDGLTYHSASSPKHNDFRAVINIAYLDY